MLNKSITNANNKQKINKPPEQSLLTRLEQRLKHNHPISALGLRRPDYQHFNHPLERKNEMYTKCDYFDEQGRKNTEEGIAYFQRKIEKNPSKASKYNKKIEKIEKNIIYI